ncbi:AI-2E family transporter [uncultured Thioclava sp.]|jgi:predicted PurR-regulated permease PerM|uniref:AI-2E family transporter n=1 Tax=Thioclava arctica TaxID=3238301 RepID=A0ABV3TI28_9RHOB|nr:AI-2E family transporter [uncultured Thioclava sp.]
MNRLETLSRVSLIVIAVIAVVGALEQVESLLAPVVLALVVGIVLSPISDAWETRGLSPVWGALTSLLISLMVAALLLLVIQPLAAQMIAQAPKVWNDLRSSVLDLRQMFQGIQDASDEVTKAIAPASNPGKDSAAPSAMPNATDMLMLAPALLAQALVYIGTLFFFQLSRRDIYDWVAKHLADSTQRGNTALRLRAAENRVSRYFLTISVINAGLGLIVAAAMQLIGMPNAALWGVIAFLINYILYLGPAVLAVALIFAGIAAFDGLRVLLPALIYLGLNSTEGQFVTPTLVGKHMRINPLLIFLSLTFGIWLWGPLGGVVAIPLLLWALVLTNSLPEDRKPAVES